MTRRHESKDRDKVFELVVLKEKAGAKKTPQNYEPLTLPAKGQTQDGGYMVPGTKEKSVKPVSKLETSARDNGDQKNSENASTRRSFACIIIFGIAILLVIVLVIIPVTALSLAGYSYSRLGTAEIGGTKISNEEQISKLYRQLENVTLRLQQLQEEMEAQNDAVRLILNSTSVRVAEIGISLSSSIASTMANISLVETTVSSLESAISSLQDEQQAINVTQSEQLAQAQAMFSSDISALTSDVANLNAVINNWQVDFSEECHSESANCSLEVVNSYFLECFTDLLPMNISNFYTLDMRCQRDLTTNLTRSQDLVTENNGVQCHCTAVGEIDLLGNHLNATDTDQSPCCKLVITRCPNTVMTRN